MGGEGHVSVLAYVLVLVLVLGTGRRGHGVTGEMVIAL